MNLKDWLELVKTTLIIMTISMFFFLAITLAFTLVFG